jgi:hypothetical protein
VRTGERLCRWNRTIALEVVGGAEIRPDQGDQGSFHRFREWSTDTPAPVHLMLLISTSLFLPEPGIFWRYLGRRSAGRRSSAVGSATVPASGLRDQKSERRILSQKRRLKGRLRSELVRGCGMRVTVSPDPRPEGARAESGLRTGSAVSLSAPRRRDSGARAPRGRRVPHLVQPKLHLSNKSPPLH